MKTLGRIARSGLLLTGTRVFGQGLPPTDANVQIPRDTAIGGEKLMPASDTALTAAAARAFWSVYDAYQKDPERRKKRPGKAIASDAEAFDMDTLTDETAKKLSDEVPAIEEAKAKRRQTHAAPLAHALAA